MCITIEFYRRQLYGRELMYIADPAYAALIKTLTHKIVIDEREKGALIKLGISFREVSAPKKADCGECDGEVCRHSY